MIDPGEVTLFAGVLAALALTALVALLVPARRAAANRAARRAAPRVDVLRLIDRPRFARRTG